MGVFLPGEELEAGSASDASSARETGPRRLTDGAADPDASSSGDSGTFGDSGVGDGGTGDGGATGCGSPNTCPTATNLGIVSGDTGQAILSASGSTSQWYYVKVTEDDHNFPGSQLFVVTELKSPPGLNFDLYIYAGGAALPLACGAPTKQSTTTGDDVIEHAWGEGLVPNGSDDSKLITIEVRHVSGACDPNKKFTLNVYGFATL
jgi:hypothetical protein